MSGETGAKNMTYISGMPSNTETCPVKGRPCCLLHLSSRSPMYPPKGPPNIVPTTCSDSCADDYRSGSLQLHVHWNALLRVMSNFPGRIPVDDFRAEEHTCWPQWPPSYQTARSTSRARDDMVICLFNRGLIEGPIEGPGRCINRS